jgi:hypothetical protein
VARESSRRRATNWHWGIPATQAILWEDPDFPEHMQEIGRLAEMHVQPVGETRTRVMAIPEQYWNDFPEDGTHAKVNRGNTQAKRRIQTHLVFDEDHPSQRMYLCLPPAVMRMFAPAYDSKDSMLLADLAQRVGGRHGKRRDYPAVRVVPLGLLHHSVYYTSKGGDENPTNVRSIYDHHQGEDGGIPPALAVDQSGRLWLAGGSYTCPVPGITK